MYTIKKNADYKKVYARGRSAGGRHLVLYALKKSGDDVRFGFSVSKKIGKAVVRNRIKRLLKEICRLNGDWFRAGYDYVIIPRRNTGGREYGELKDDLARLALKVFERKNQTGRNYSK